VRPKPALSGVKLKGLRKRSPAVVESTRRGIHAEVGRERNSRGQITEDSWLTEGGPLRSMGLGAMKMERSLLGTQLTPTMQTCREFRASEGLNYGVRSSK
jgi:hypothetical protein